MSWPGSIRLPPQLTWTNHACFSCFEEPENNTSLQRCSRCKRICYCSAKCQKANWASHKAFCKAFNAIENDQTARMAFLYHIPGEPSTDVATLNKISEFQGRNKAQLLALQLKRSLDVVERNLVGWEPRCIVCTRSDQDIRMEALQLPSKSLYTVRPCPDCKLAFFCSDSHREFARQLHSGAPCEEGHHGLSQCAVYQEILRDLYFSSAVAKTGTDTPFMWMPDRKMEKWASLDGQTWQGEFSTGLAASLGIPVAEVGTFLRAASDALSLPLTILLALEKLNVDDTWARKESLNVHILGATQEEIMRSAAFEEILHRLPLVKKLKILMCGPELPEGSSGQDIDIETCPDCQKNGRNRIHRLEIKTYHDYVKDQGKKYIAPDVVVAFNCDAAETDLWGDTVKILVAKKIPSLFTSFNSEEAKDDSEVLKSHGAKITLGPVQNPWGSQRLLSEPNKVYGFFGRNRWIAGGFNSSTV